jgi:tetratricopeptide (TPR) repeat protein
VAALKSVWTRALRCLVLACPLLACEQEVRLTSDPAAADYVAAAGQREAEGDPLGALSDLRDALRLFPHSLEAWRERARLAATLNQLQEALDAYQRLSAALPSDAAAANGLAQVALHVGDLELAEQAAERLCSSPAVDADGWALAARIAYESGAEALCVERAEAALRLDPEHPEALYRLAQRAQTQNQIPEALRGFERVLANDPGHAGACFALGTLLAQGEQTQETRERANRLQACAQVVHELNGVTFKAAPALERIARAENAVALHPSWSRGYVELARALLESDRPAEAEQALVKAQQARPALREVWLLRARAAQALGRPKQAAKWLQQWKAAGS